MPYGKQQQTNSMQPSLGVYHPPYSVVNQITNLIITADINLHLNNLGDPDGSTFLDNLDILGLELHCRFAMHKQGNTLDVFLTEISSSTTICSCKPGPFISDHSMVQCTTSIPHKDIIQESVTFRKIKDIEVAQFANDVEKHPLLKSEGHTDDVNTLVANLETALWEVLDSHVPEKSKVITCRPKYPWYSSEIKHQNGVVRWKEKIWQKYREDHQWIAYKVEKRK